DLEGTIAALQDVITLAQSHSECWSELATALFNRGLGLYLNGQLHMARTDLDEAMTIARAYRDQRSIGLNFLALAQIDRADRDEIGAVDKLREALPILLASGDM